MLRVGSIPSRRTFRHNQQTIKDLTVNQIPLNVSSEKSILAGGEKDRRVRMYCLNVLLKTLTAIKEQTENLETDYSQLQVQVLPCQVHGVVIFGIDRGIKIKISHEWRRNC